MQEGHLNKFIKLGIMGAFIVGLALLVIFGGSKGTSASPGYTIACESCHSYQGGNLRITTDVASLL